MEGRMVERHGPGGDIEIFDKNNQLLSLIPASQVKFQLKYIKDLTGQTPTKYTAKTTPSKATPPSASVAPSNLGPIVTNKPATNLGPNITPAKPSQAPVAQPASAPDETKTLMIYLNDAQKNQITNQLNPIDKESFEANLSKDLKTNKWFMSKELFDSRFGYTNQTPKNQVVKLPPPADADFDRFIQDAQDRSVRELYDDAKDKYGESWANRLIRRLNEKSRVPYRDPNQKVNTIPLK
jgi:hypothetical protein